MRDYKKYTAWKKAHRLTLTVYKAAAQFPKEELYGLTSQIKRASSSIPSNIAEGSGRKTDKDFCRFLYIAFGSANELEYQISLSIDLKFISQSMGEEILEQVKEVKKILNGLITSLNK